MGSESKGPVDEEAGNRALPTEAGDLAHQEQRKRQVQVKVKRVIKLSKFNNQLKKENEVMNLKNVVGARAIGLAIAALLSACGGGDGGDSSTPVIGQNGAVDVNTVALPAGQTCGIGNFAPALLAAINQARSQARNCGGVAYPAAPALGWNSLLTQAAVGHSTDMASKGFFSHTGSDGRGYTERIESTGYSGFPSEILANPTGSFSAGQIIPLSMKSWLASPGHCAAIMDPVLTEMGSACVKTGNKAYVTVDLGG